MNIKRPLIIDLSSWELDADWQAQASDPPLLMITRLTLGKDFIDAVAGAHIEGAQSIGSKVGVYHFLHFNDIQGQIDIFLENAELAGALVDGLWTFDVPPILDVELAPNGSSDPEGSSFAHQIKTWLDAVEAATGQRPWIYTNWNYWQYTNDRSGSPPAWTANYKLWVAQYFDQPDLHEIPFPLPTGWTEWHLWQYSAAGRIPAFQYDGVDLNKASNALLAELGAPQPPPPIGDPMFKYHLLGANPTNPFTNMRATPSASAQDVGDFLNGHFGDGDNITESGTPGTATHQKWLQLETYDGQTIKNSSGAVIRPWVAVIYNGQTLNILTENPVAPPPPAGEKVVKILLTAEVDGVTYVPDVVEGTVVKMKKG